MRRITTPILTALALPLCAGAQQQSPHAGNYPTRPIRMIVTISPGGGPDIVTRMVGQIVTDKLGQPVVVDNRPGGGTVLATDLVAHAAPDGYTLLVGSDTLMLLGAMKRVAYDIRIAFVPVVQMTSQWYVLVITPALPVKNVRELIAYAKSKPDVLTFASQGMGTTGHLSMENFKSLTGTAMVHAPYKGAAPALLDIMSGQIHLMFSSMVSALPHIASGKLRVVATAAPQRVAQLPDVVTVSESGVPGFKASNNYGLYAPTGTPRAIVQALSHVVAAGLNTPAMHKRLAAQGAEPVSPQTPEAFKAMIAQEYLVVEKQVRGLRIKDL